MREAKGMFGSSAGFLLVVSVMHQLWSRPEGIGDSIDTRAQWRIH